MGSEPSARRPSPLRRDPLGPGSGSLLQAWAGSGSRPRSGAPCPLQLRGQDCAVRGAPVPGAGAPRATRPAPLASVVCGRSPVAPARGRGRRGPLFGHSSLGSSGPWPRTSAPSRARSSGLAARRPPPPVSPPAPPLAPLRPRPCGLGGLRSGPRSCWPAVVSGAGSLWSPFLRSGGPSVVGSLAGSPLPAASACRAGSRPNRGRFGRPPPPRGVGGPPAPAGGAGAPSVWRSAPGLLRCGAGAPAGAACLSFGYC